MPTDTQREPSLIQQRIEAEREAALALQTELLRGEPIHINVAIAECRAARAATDEAVKAVEGLVDAIAANWTDSFAIRDLLVEAGRLKLDTVHPDARCRVGKDHCAHYYAGGTCCGCKAIALTHTTGGASDETR